MKLHQQLFLYIAFIVSGINRCAAQANYPSYVQRQTDYRSTALANFGDDAITIQAYEGLPLDTPTLTSFLNGISTGSTSDFEIVQLIRCLYFTNGAYDSMILPVLNGVPYWINHDDTLRVFWSENHMSMWMSSEWLLHERYGKVVDSSLRNRLVHYLQLKTHFNYYEFFSTVYNPYCLSGLLNLADFAQDTLIKNLATQAAQILMKDLLLPTNDQGVIYATAGRNYDDKYESPYGQNHNDLIYLLTGMGQVPFGASHAGGFLSTSSILVDTVIDSWKPVIDTVYRFGHTIDTGLILNAGQSSVDSVIFGWSAGEYFHPLLALATFNLLTDSDMWGHPDFSEFVQLKSTPVSDVVVLANSLNFASESSVICNDTIALYKHYSVTLSSVQDFWPGKMGYQQYPCVANVENTSVFTASGQVLPWAARSADIANDDLPYVKQVKNVALEMYRSDAKPPIIGPSYPQVTLHWIDQNFTEEREDSMWLLGRVNNNYVAVLRSCTGYIDTFRACDIPNGQAWVIMVGDSETYGSFNQFEQVIDSAQFTQQWYYDTAAQQEVFYAKIVVDSITIDYAWADDSTLPAGINYVGAPPAFNVYPNPANASVNIALNNVPQNGMLEIYNTAGQLVYQTAVTNQLMTIPTGRLSNGVYAIKLSTDANNIDTRCFVVNH
jgi:hypothetical protein